MIEMKEGKVNELIYNETVYNKSTNTLSPNLIEIGLIIKQLCQIEETCNYIQFNPFYRNSRLDCQIEFDDYMFYMECRDNFTKEEIETHWTECMDNIYDIPHEVKQYTEMSEYEKRMARTLYPICKNGDFESYHQYLQNFNNYLDELIPKLFEEAIKKLDLNQDDLAFGYFCFEVNSG